MKQLLIFASFLIAALNASAQKKSYGVDSTGTYTFVEKNPEFIGGERLLMDFIHKNLVYPNPPLDSTKETRVIVRFVINPDGSVSDVTIRRHLSKKLDEEAVRVVKMLPKFKPGEQQGKPVKVYYNLPIDFRKK